MSDLVNGVRNELGFTFLLVLFLPRPQNRARKPLCNLRTLKPRRVDFTRRQQFLTFFFFERNRLCIANYIQKPNFEGRWLLLVWTFLSMEMRPNQCT